MRSAPGEVTSPDAPPRRAAVPAPLKLTAAMADKQGDPAHRTAHVAGPVF
jgi:hypothetical protein